MTQKNIILAVVIACIIAGIWYFEKDRPARTTGDSVNIASQNSESLKKDLLYSKAKEVTSPDGFINSSPFALKDLIGKKVILVDFMTYSCINCQRTFPYMNEWYKKYKDMGLEIVGIHTPEFEFEKKIFNVQEAMKRFEIDFPIVLDNDFSTWNVYGNRYWPHKYLIDIDGYIVYDHVGEGNYEETEKKIQSALAERAKRLGEKINVEMEVTKTDTAAMPEAGSPETYFGALRNGNLANGKPYTLGLQHFVLPAQFDKNLLYLSGPWNIEKEYAENSVWKTKIVFQFNAKKVFFVAEADSEVELKIKVDGKYLDASTIGEDVKINNGVSTVEVKGSRLYELYNATAVGEHTLEIEVGSPGLRAYTFTFG